MQDNKDQNFRSGPSIPQKTRKNYSLETMEVLSVALEMGFIIALPITLFALLGKWLDNKYAVKYFAYIGIVLALIISTYWLYRRFSEILAKLNQAAKGEKQPGNQQQDQKNSHQ